MRLVLIEWMDSHVDGGWRHLDDDVEDRAIVCRSVGWLILDGEQAKVIAPHMNEPEEKVPRQAAGVMTIPARAVLRITGLTQRDPHGDESVTCPSSCQVPA